MPGTSGVYAYYLLAWLFQEKIDPFAAEKSLAWIPWEEDRHEKLDVLTTRRRHVQPL